VTVSGALEAAVALEAWGDRRGWAGPDPYDGLSATRLVGPLKRTVGGRRVLSQLVKRSPIDLRPLLGISPGHSAASLAQVASAYARNGFLSADDAQTKLSATLARLEELRAPDLDDLAFGYHFDVQTRVFFYPRGAPNVIATAFAGNAFLDAHETTGDAAWLARAQSVGEFFIRHVPQTEDEPGSYFGYLVGDRTPIHNANLLVCAVLARLHRLTGDERFGSAARDGITYTLARQAADGSWPYGEQAHLRWVDGHHTGYILEALLVAADAGIPVDMNAWRKGMEFYERNLFLADGAPKYYAGSLYPLDVQALAQGIQTFARAAGREPRYAVMAEKIFAYGMLRFRRDDGAFVFQRRRFWANSTPHVRWGQAPMLLALSHLLAVDAP
jgi:hypothetical protein